MEEKIKTAAEKIIKAKHLSAFTGAGISVESGIPPFRGKDGLWNTYDPIVLDLNYFFSNPKKSWEVIHELFYDFFGKAIPNDAHIALAELEKLGFLKSIITQNIDNLHQEAGSSDVIEFHGTAQSLICTNCEKSFSRKEIDLNELPPLCKSCNSLLKPDFIFFGEGIPTEAYRRSIEEAEKSDVFLIIGTSGEVMPASMIPKLAKQNNACIIEINTDQNIYANSIDDIFLQGKASIIMKRIFNQIQTII